MAKRRRYDTEALVDQLQSERRTGIVLTLLGGAFVLSFLIALAIFGGGEEEPQKTKDDARAAVAEGDKPKAEGEAAKAEGEEKSAEKAEEKAEEKEEPKGPGTLKLSLSKKALVWVDGKKIGKLKKKSMELDPGKHTIKAKFGKKTVTHEFEVVAGETLSLAGDHRKKKFTAK